MSGIPQGVVEKLLLATVFGGTKYSENKNVYIHAIKEPYPSTAAVRDLVLHE